MRPQGHASCELVAASLSASLIVDVGRSRGVVNLYVDFRIREVGCKTLKGVEGSYELLLIDVHEGFDSVPLAAGGQG